MATVTYTFVSRCAGGGHTTFDISFNGGANRRTVYTTDEMLKALSALTQDEIDFAFWVVARAHFGGRTRPQVVTELNAGPVVITI